MLPIISISSFQGKLKRVGVALCVSINVSVVSLSHEDPWSVIPITQLRYCAQPERSQRAGDLDPGD